VITIWANLTQWSIHMVSKVDMHCYLQLVIAKVTHKHVVISKCYLCTDICSGK